MIGFVLLYTDPQRPQTPHWLGLSLREKIEKYLPMAPSTRQKAKYRDE